MLNSEYAKAIEPTAPTKVHPRGLDAKWIEPTKHRSGYWLANDLVSKIGPFGTTHGKTKEITVQDMSLPGLMEQFFEYIQGKGTSESSQQKKLVMDLTKKEQGVGYDELVKFLDTPQKIQDFVFWHEQSHVENDTPDVYFAKGRNLLTEDKLAIEARANIDALKKMGYKFKPTASVDSDLESGRYDKDEDLSASYEDYASEVVPIDYSADNVSDVAGDAYDQWIAEQEGNAEPTGVSDIDAELAALFNIPEEVASEPLTVEALQKLIDDLLTSVKKTNPQLTKEQIFDINTELLKALGFKLGTKFSDSDKGQAKAWKDALAKQASFFGFTDKQAKEALDGVKVGIDHAINGIRSPGTNSSDVNYVVGLRIASNAGVSQKDYKLNKSMLEGRVNDNAAATAFATTKSKKESYLSTYPKFFDNLKENRDYVLGDIELSPVMERALNELESFDKEFTTKFNTIFQSGKNKNYYAEDPIQFFKKDGFTGAADSFDANFVSTMAMIGANYANSLLGATLSNDDAAINAIMQRSPSAGVNDVEREFLSTIGINFSEIAEALGNEVLASMGITSKSTTPAIEQSRLALSIGTNILHVLADMNMVEVRALPSPLLAGLIKNDRLKDDEAPVDLIEASKETESSSKGKPFRVVTHFIHAKTDSAEIDGELYEDVPSKAIVDFQKNMEDASGIFDTLFNVRDRRREVTFNKPTIEDVPTHSGGGTQESTPLAKDAIHKLNTQPWQVRMATAVPWLKLSATNQEKFVGVVDPDQKHAFNRESQKAINLSLRNQISDFQSLFDRNKAVGLTTPFYIVNTLQDNQRMGNESNTVDPLNHKLHRELVGSPAWTVKIKTAADRTEFKKAVLAAFGEKPHLMTDVFVPKLFEEFLEKPHIIEGIAAMRAMQTEENPSDATQEALLDAVEKIDEKMYGFAGLVALTAYSPTEVFETNIFSETDGITNGTMIGRRQIKSAENQIEVLEQLKRGGYYENSANSVVEHFNNTKVDTNDAYEHNTVGWAHNFNAFMEALSPNDSTMQLHNVEKLTERQVDRFDSATEQLNRIAGSPEESFKKVAALQELVGTFLTEDGKVSSFGRNLSKYPVMISAFLASPNRIIEQLAEDILKGIHESIEEAWKEGDQTKLDRISKNLSTIIGTEHKIPMLNALNTEYPLPTLNYIKQVIALSYGEALAAAMSADNNISVNNKRLLNNAMVVSSHMYIAAFEAAEKAKEEEVGRSLSQVELEKIRDSLAHMAPIVRHGTSATSPSVEGYGNDGILMVKESRVRYGKKDDTNKNKPIGVQTPGAGKNQPGVMTMKLRTYDTGGQITDTLRPQNLKTVTTYPSKKTLTDRGIAGVILLTHSLDAATMQKFIMLGYEMLNIHDAKAVSITNSLKSTQELNGIHEDVMLSYSMATEAQRTLDRVHAGFLKLNEDSKGALLHAFNTSLNKNNDRILKKTDLNGFVLKFHADVVELNNFKSETDASIKHTGQYAGGENSGSTVTPEQQEQIIKNKEDAEAAAAKVLAEAAEAARSFNDSTQGNTQRTRSKDTFTTSDASLQGMIDAAPAGVFKKDGNFSKKGEAHPLYLSHGEEIEAYLKRKGKGTATEPTTGEIAEAAAIAEINKLNAEITNSSEYGTVINLLTILIPKGGLTIEQGQIAHDLQVMKAALRRDPSLTLKDVYRYDITQGIRSVRAARQFNLQMKDAAKRMADAHTKRPMETAVANILNQDAVSVDGLLDSLDAHNRNRNSSLANIAADLKGHLPIDLKIRYINSDADLMKAMKDFGLTTTIINQGTFVPRSKADGGAPVIVIRGNHFLYNGANSETILHELLHAATVDVIHPHIRYTHEQGNPDRKAQVANADKAPDGVKRLVRLYNALKRSDYKGPALANVDEMIAYGLTDEAFQNYLRNTNLSWWQSFVKAISGLFHLESSALNELIAATRSVLVPGADFTTLRNDNSADQYFHQAAATGSFQEVYRDDVGTEQTLQIFDDLNAVGFTKDSNAHTENLRSTLANVVNKVITPFNYVLRESNGVDVYNAPNTLALEVNNNKQLVNGSRMSAQETFVNELVYNVTQTGIKAYPAIRRKLRALYEQTEKHFMDNNIGPEFFLNDPADATNPESMKLAKDRYNHLFGSGNKNIKSEDYLSMFMAFGTTNAKFGQVLSTIKKENAKPTNESLLNKLVRLLTNLMDAVGDKIKGTSHKTTDVALYGLLENVVSLHQRKKSSLFGKYDLLKPIETATVEGLKRYVVAPIKAVATSKFVQENKKATVFMLGALVNELTESKAGMYTQGMAKTLRRLGFTRDSFIGSLITEMRGPTADTVKFYQIARMSNLMVDQLGKDIAHNSTLAINNSFATELNDADRKALLKVLLNTDLQSYVDQNTSADELISLLTDPSALQAEIAKLEGELKQFSLKQRNFYRNHADNLGHFMVTGKANQDIHMLLNAHNIVNFYGTESKNKAKGDLELAESLVDKLATLYALKYSEPAYKTTAAKVIKAETEASPANNGAIFTLQVARMITKKSPDTLFGGNKAAMLKGYSKESLDPDISTTIATKDEEASLIRQGFKLVGPLNKDSDDSTKGTEQFIYVHKEGLNVGWAAGATSTESPASRGANLYKVHQQSGSQDPSTSALNEGREVLKKKLVRANQAFKATPTYTTRSMLVPVFNSDGDVSAYRYIMSESMKDDLLNKDNDFAKTLGNTEASLTRKPNGKEIDRTVVQALYDNYKENFRKNPEKFVAIGPGTTQKDYQEIYALMPSDMRRAVKEIWGTNTMQVPDTLVRLLFGYREVSVKNLHESKQPSAVAHRSIMGSFGKYLGKKLSAPIGIKGEKVWQEIAGVARDTIVIKGLDVLAGNIGSNNIALWWMGVAHKNSVAYQAEGLTSMLQYQKDHTELLTLSRELEVSARVTNRTQKKRRIERLQKALDNNPVAPLIKEGLYQSIVEDVAADDSQYTSASKAKSFIADKAAGLPKVLKDSTRHVFLTHESELYQLLKDTTAVSDFVARYALHKSNTEDHGMDYRESIEQVAEMFVNYDNPTHRSIEYANRMGFAMFTKYYFRSQKTVLMAAARGPAKMITTLFAQNWLTEVLGISNPSDITDGFVFNMSPMSKFNSVSDIVDAATDVPVLNFMQRPG